MYLLTALFVTFSLAPMTIAAVALETARAVYQSDPAYDRIVFVGHSLGSVIAYDTLNRRLREESIGKSRTSAPASSSTIGHRRLRSV